MPKKAGIALTPFFFLQLCLGLFFLMLGIVGLGDYNSKLSEAARLLGRNDSLRVVMAVVELVMGAILVAGLFVKVPAGLAKIFSITLFALWALYMLIALVFNDSFLEPSAVVWLYNLSWHAVILSALWMVGKKYMD
jgi:hypothetical protein